MLDIQFNRTKNAHHHVRKFISIMTLKGIDNDISDIIFLCTFHKDVMTWGNVVSPQKVTTWSDLCKEFLCQYSYNADHQLHSGT